MTSSSKHKPWCATNTHCAVYHEDGICTAYRECNCGAGLPKKDVQQKECGCRPIGMPYPRYCPEHLAENVNTPKTTWEGVDGLMGLLKAKYGNDEYPNCPATISWDFIEREIRDSFASYQRQVEEVLEGLDEYTLEEDLGAAVLKSDALEKIKNLKP